MHSASADKSAPYKMFCAIYQTKVVKQVRSLVQLSKCGKKCKKGLYNFSELKYNADIKQNKPTGQRKETLL